jgi:hypothetical protein
MSKEKPKFAMFWADSCGGCEIAVLNIHEQILDFDANFEVVFWPVAMDAKYKDLEAMEDESILLTLFNGAIHSEEHEHIAHLLRTKIKNPGGLRFLCKRGMHAGSDQPEQQKRFLRYRVFNDIHG